MPVPIVTQKGIVMKRILTIEEAAFYCNRSIDFFKNNFPGKRLDHGRKGISVDCNDVDLWIDSWKEEQSSNDAERALEEF